MNIPVESVLLGMLEFLNTYAALRLPSHPPPLKSEMNSVRLVFLCGMQKKYEDIIHVISNRYHIKKTVYEKFRLCLYFSFLLLRRFYGTIY